MGKRGARKDPIIRAQIKAMLDRGLSNREIAKELDYSTQRIWELRKEIEAEQAEKEVAV